MASPEVTMIPDNYVTLTDPEDIKNLNRTLDLLDEDDDVQTGNKLISGIDENSELKLDNLDKKQHFTQPPAHYTEASLVKTLEELGIGRPSTYAPTITTIIARRYVAKENKNLYVTELGEAVNNIMLKAFPTIVDVNFTATMEALLDSVEEGTVDWKTVIRNFYPDLDESVKAEYKENPEIESKGFCEAVTIRDFPIRDKGVDLIVRRRKWYDKQNNRYFSDSYDLKAEETRYSKEFAAFLKGVYGDDSYDLPFA